MPFPNPELVRKAIEKAVHETLALGEGKWNVGLGNGDEIEPRMYENGFVEVIKCLPDAEIDQTPDDQPVEKTYRLRVVVQLLPNTP
jgi:hypothetical protein